MKLINILKEIRVLPAGSVRRLSPQDIQDINVVFEFFGENDSDFDLHKPMTEYRDSTYYGTMTDDGFEPDDENDPQYLAYQRLVKKPKGVYLGTDSYISPCPGAPANYSFYMRLEVNFNSNDGPFIVLSIPYYDTDAGRYSVGWFDALGKYHADTAHFNEDGNYIG
jgi:hypothetical protein